jgi:hypothetical protein
MGKVQEEVIEGPWLRHGDNGMDTDRNNDRERHSAPRLRVLALDLKRSRCVRYGTRMAERPLSMVTF